MILITFVRFITVVLIVLLPISVQAGENLVYADERSILDQAHVRGFIWGLPLSVVKEGEESIFVEEDDRTLFYVDTIRGINSSINYEFENDKLNRVRIFAEKEYPNPQDLFEDLVTIKHDLENRFGAPVEENFDWRDEKYKKYSNEWGWAVYLGHVFITLKWEDKETLVTAYLGAPSQFKPVLLVTYEDAKAKKAKIKQKTDNAIKITP